MRVRTSTVAVGFRCDWLSHWSTPSVEADSPLRCQQISRHLTSDCDLNLILMCLTSRVMYPGTLLLFYHREKNLGFMFIVWRRRLLHGSWGIEDEWELDPLSLGLSIPHRFSFKIPHLIRTCNKGVVSVRVKILGIETNQAFPPWLCSSVCPVFYWAGKFQFQSVFPVLGWKRERWALLGTGLKMGKILNTGMGIQLFQFQDQPRPENPRYSEKCLMHCMFRRMVLIDQINKLKAVAN